MDKRWTIEAVTWIYNNAHIGIHGIIHDKKGFLSD